MVNKEKIHELILKALTDLIETFPENERFVPSSETVLFGQGSAIDSLTLVSFIVDLEALLSAEYGEEISLTDDRAMTREKSPFSNVGSLADYIQEIL